MRIRVSLILIALACCLQAGASSSPLDGASNETILFYKMNRFDFFALMMARDKAADELHAPPEAYSGFTVMTPKGRRIREDWRMYEPQYRKVGLGDGAYTR